MERQITPLLKLESMKILQDFLLSRFKLEATATVGFVQLQLIEKISKNLSNTTASKMNLFIIFKWLHLSQHAWYTFKFTCCLFHVVEDSN